MTKRPYTDVQDLVDAAVDQATDVKILPAVDRLDKATNKLEAITPLLQGMVKRQNVHMIWLTILTAAVLLLFLVVFGQDSYIP